MSDIFAGLESDDLSETTPVLTGLFDTAIAARKYLRAGKATITLRSKKTQTRFTYRVVAARDEEGKPSADGTLFVGLLSGPDNTSNYSYVGRVARDIFWAGRKTPRVGDVGKDAPSSKAFAWAWQKLLRGELPESLEIWHEGRCGRCNRKLTVPESVASGFGPECITKVGF